MNDALLAIARNAVALLYDAKLLFDQGRYPRAAALAVLAAEEAGKFWLVKWEPYQWKDKFYNHRDKIDAGARFNPAELVPGSTDGMLAAYKAAPDNPEWTEWVQRARSFLPFKLNGLYVDLNDAGELTSVPVEVIGPDTAATCIDYARSEVERLYKAELVRASLPPLTPA
jgi:AbiV family abortive infection protein